MLRQRDKETELLANCTNGGLYQNGKINTLSPKTKILKNPFYMYVIEFGVIRLGVHY